MDTLFTFDAEAADLGSERFNCNQLRGQQASTPDGDRGRPAGNRRALRVLVLDDEPDTADGLAMLVRLWGHTVRTANNGPAALRMAAEQPPHVMLLDIEMPRMDGCEVARTMRLDTAREDCLIIAITGWTDEKHRRECIAAGIDLLLIKPVDPSVVETLLTMECGRVNRLPRDNTLEFQYDDLRPLIEPERRGMASRRELTFAFAGHAIGGPSC